MHYFSEEISGNSNGNPSIYQDGIFSYSGNTFSIQLVTEVRIIEWNDILLISAYKIDQFTVDSIIIDIHFAETCISINDQTEGYLKFMDVAAERLVNFKRDWFSVVAFPPIETNLTTIYEKPITRNEIGSH